MAKYRLVKQTFGDGGIRYSIQKKTFFFYKEIDYNYNEDLAFENFNKKAIKPKIEILKEV